jgi:hypothetical protein
MSSDLLAEFDSFYRAPQSGTPNDTSAPSTSRPTSAFEDLSFLGTPNPTQNHPGHSQPQWNTQPPKPSDDIWGNFEALGAGNTQHATAASASDPWGIFQPRETSGGTRQQEPRSKKTGYEGNLQGSYKAETRSSNPSIVRRPTIDIFSSNIADLAELTPTPQQNRSLPSYPSARTTSQYTNTNIPPNDSSNILFDAADELNGNGDDDDFGDFETVSLPIPQIDLLQIGPPFKAEKSMKRPSELLRTDKSLKASPFPYPQAPKSPSFKERNPFTDLAVTTPPISSTKKDAPPNTESPVTAWPVYEAKIPATGPYHDSPAANNPEEEDWGDFEDLPTEAKVEPSKSGIEIDAWAWDTVDSQAAPGPIPSAEAPPPTNIPPPSVLLAMFPQLFNLPQSSLFQAVANQPFALKNRILSDPSTIYFLRAYILIATVAARIIAGRKLRWKRDTHLSQAMKIGPAVAHGKGGMKLTGVDKAETTREEREAADLVRIWREQVGRLRSAVAAANSSLHDQSVHLAVPEITENMNVKTEGGLTAPKACVLCGLKREERIPKVDFQVEDSFGEWWVEHWGHRGCRNFWQEHESKLRHR